MHKIYRLLIICDGVSLRYTYVQLFIDILRARSKVYIVFKFTDYVSIAIDIVWHISPKFSKLRNRSKVSEHRNLGSKLYMM